MSGEVLADEREPRGDGDEGGADVHGLAFGGEEDLREDHAWRLRRHLERPGALVDVAAQLCLLAPLIVVQSLLFPAQVRPCAPGQVAGLLMLLLLLLVLRLLVVSRLLVKGMLRRLVGGRVVTLGWRVRWIPVGGKGGALVLRWERGVPKSRRGHSVRRAGHHRQPGTQVDRVECRGGAHKLFELP